MLQKRKRDNFSTVFFSGKRGFVGKNASPLYVVIVRETTELAKILSTIFPLPELRRPVQR